MYITHTAHISHAVEDCVTALRRSPRTWFPGLKDDRSSRVGIKVAGLPIRKRVSVELGKLQIEGSWAEVPITWKATGPKPLFPDFHGKLQLAPVERLVTRLTVSGMYEPPLGRVGIEIDEAFMHTVAEETVKDLAKSISRQLEKATT